MAPITITWNTTMGDILAAYPKAKVGLFQKYHIGGCNACAYQMTDTLAEVKEQHKFQATLEDVVATVAASDALEATLHVSPEDLLAELKNGATPKILDARFPIDFDNGHLANAQLISAELTFQALDEWPKETPVVVYSNKGERSLARASHFRAYGLKNVRSLTGGLEAWAAFGGEVIRKE